MTKELTSLPKYEAYKDSGVKDFGALPLHWEVLKFKNIFKFQKGLNITKENLQDEGIPCVNYGEIHSKYGFEVDPIVHPLRCVSQEYLKSSAQSLLKFGDFIFADTSEDIEGSGNFTHLNSCELTFAGYHTIIVKATKKINFRYMAYVFDSLSYRMQIRTNVKGVKVYSITNGILKNTSVWFPSENEQNNIVCFLDDKSNLVDRAIAIKQRQIELLKERKQILIQSAVTRGLNPDAPMRDSGVEWLGKTPQHWSMVRVKDVSSFITSGPRGWSSYFGDLGAYFLQSGDVDESLGVNYRDAIKVNPPSGSEGLRTRLRSGDILVCITGAKTGKVGVCFFSEEEIYINQHLCLIRPRKAIDSEFLAFLLHSKVGRTYFHLQQYGLKEGLGLDDVKNSLVLLPPLDEQEKIVAIIKSNSRKIDKAISLQKQQIEKLKEYKATLINSAVTGKIKVPQLAGREVVA